MYTKDMNKKMTLRLSSDLENYVITQSEKYFTTPSDFIRQCIVNFKTSQEMAEKMVSGGFKVVTTNGGLENGNDQQSNINNKL